ncbi:Flp family type IVb pilin [Lentisphaerota bacterium ZTH]|nr:Flp family type IVb pilin [Lentisphaerota bacterium]WET05784.1 Flp family type IVb pilin [Lentisphaerota bacterium ZTH]
MSRIKEFRNRKIWRKAARALAGEKGATFIEYAMLAGLIAIVVAVAVAIFGGRLRSFFNDIGGKVEDASGQVNSADITVP